jgi:pimeloyl-ACP methyl ester carboxylesterase
VSNVILLHDAWHGGWCWSYVMPLLQRANHQVYAPDLPSHGRDKTPLEKVTLKAYAACVGRVLTALDDPAIVVGHGMSGIILNQIGEWWPNKIQQLIYLCAYILPSGGTLMEAADQDTTCELPADAFLLDEEKGTVALKSDVAVSYFYEDCSPEDAAFAAGHLTAQALLPLLTPVETSAERFGRLPRSYIHCTSDKVISYPFQQTMCARLSCLQRTLTCGHSPFLSQPDKLVEQILTVMDEHKYTYS